MTYSAELNAPKLGRACKRRQLQKCMRGAAAPPPPAAASTLTLNSPRHPQVAWDNVEEVSAARAHKKANEPVEVRCLLCCALAVLCARAFFGGVAGAGATTHTRHTRALSPPHTHTHTHLTQHTLRTSWTSGATTATRTPTSAACM